MRVEQGSGPLQSSAANSLPIRCRRLEPSRNSAAGRDRKIGDKLLIYFRFMVSRGRLLRAKPNFFPVGREMARVRRGPSSLGPRAKQYRKPVPLAARSFKNRSPNPRIRDAQFEQPRAQEGQHHEVTARDRNTLA